jgi:predicted CXXCH cytochrome family protein
MKKILVVLAVTIIALVAAGVSMAAITGSKHDLTFNGNDYYTTATTEICVFCHTPHNANNIGANAVAPLWNKTYVSNVSYTAYGNTSRGTATATAMTSSTKACLSCHDGTQAMNSLANGPGSGNTSIPATGLNAITGVAVIDGDFRNDHPIGVAYITANDLRTPAAAGVGGIVRINAVNSVFATSGTDTVECASCHSVHNDSGIALFLPVANTGSQLCITCHLK